MNFTESVVRSFATVREMLRDRGHRCPDLDDIDIRQFVSTKSVFSIDAAPPEKVRIVYNLNSKFRMNDVRKALEERKDEGETETEKAGVTVLLISRTPVSSTNAKQISDIEGVHVDVFEVSELIFNISKHTLVPLHEPVRDAADVKAVVDTYRLKSAHQLPLIQKTDPMARYLGLRPGQLARITRYSPTSGVYVLYRCCV